MTASSIMYAVLLRALAPSHYAGIVTGNEPHARKGGVAEASWAFSPSRGTVREGGAHMRVAGQRHAQRHEQALALALLRLPQRLHPGLVGLRALERALQLAALPCGHHRLCHLAQHSQRADML